MGARVLIALCGLLRSYQIAWPVLARQLRVAELGADVIVLTYLDAACTESDVASGHCPRDWASMSAQKRRAELHATIGPRLRLVHNASIPLKDRKFGTGLEARAIEFMRATWSATHVRAHTFGEQPSMHELAKLASVIFDAYDVVVFTRPDVILVPLVVRSGERAMGTFDLLRTCKAYPAFQMVSGSLYRPFWYHSRDWDFTHILCRPVTVSAWLMLDAAQNDTCAHYLPCRASPPVPPARPPGFSGEWDGPAETPDSKRNVCTMPGRMLCDRLVYFANRQLSIMALPDALVLSHLVKLRPPLAAPPVRTNAGARAHAQNGTLAEAALETSPPATFGAARAAELQQSERRAAWPTAWVPCVRGREDSRGLLCAGNGLADPCKEYRPVVLGGAPFRASPPSQQPRVGLGWHANITNSSDNNFVAARVS